MRSLLRRLDAERHPLRFVMSRVLWKTGLCSNLLIRAQGYKLKFQPSALSATLWIDPHYADSDKAILQQVLRPGDTYLDVGANIGDLALFAANIVGPQGSVYAIEAHPRTFSYLQQNLALNRELAARCHTFNVAVGSTDGKLHFSDQRSDDQNRVSERGIEVPVRRLDDLLHDVREIRLLKIDVEGFEKFVIEGAKEVLERTEYVYFEAYDQHSRSYGYGMSEVGDMLVSNGFDVPTFDSSTCVNVLASKRAAL